MKRLLIIGAFSLLAACELVIDVDRPNFQPSLVVGSVLSPDSAVWLFLSKDIYVLDPKPEEVGVNGATVKLFEGDALVASLTNRTYISDNLGGTYNVKPGFYGSDFKPQAGKPYRIEIEKDGYKKAVAISEIPREKPVAEVLSAKRIDGGINNSGFQVEYQVRLKIDDPAGANFYGIKSSLKYSLKGEIDGGEASRIGKDTIVQIEQPFGFMTLLSDNLLVDEYLSDRSSQNIWFDDKLFDGKSFETDFEVGFYRGSPPDVPDVSVTNTEEAIINEALFIEIRQLSEPYFNYYNSAALQRYLGEDDFFAEPVQVYTNVENGKGIFGAYNPLILAPEIQEEN